MVKFLLFYVLCDSIKLLCVCVHFTMCLYKCARPLLPLRSLCIFVVPVIVSLSLSLSLSFLFWFTNVNVFFFSFFFQISSKQLQQYKSGAIQILSQNDGSKENHDGEKVRNDCKWKTQRNKIKHTL